MVLLIAYLGLTACVQGQTKGFQNFVVYRVIQNQSSIFGGEVGNRKRKIFHIGKHGCICYVVGQNEPSSMMEKTCKRKW